MSHFNQSNIERKNFVDNKVQETIGDVFCPICRNEKCVYISTNKTTSFCDCKKCKACCHVLNIPIMDQNPTIMSFGGDGTPCFARKTSRDYEKEKPFPFPKKFSANHNQPLSNLNQKGQKLFHLWHNRVGTLLVDTVKPKLHLHSHFIHFQSTLKQHDFLSQSATTVLSGLSTLVQIQ